MGELKQATQAIGKGTPEHGLALLNGLIETEQDLPAALGHRAWLFRSTGRYEEAIADYRRLLALEPGDGQARALCAEALLLAGQAREAIGMALEAVQRDPLNRRAGEVITQAQRALCPPDEAAERHPSQALAEALCEDLNPMLTLFETDPAHFPTSILPHLGRLIYWIARCQRPRRILEIGTHVGYSATGLGQAVADNGVGHVHSVDLFLDHAAYTSPLVGRVADALQVARVHLAQAGLSAQVTFHRREQARPLAQQLGLEPGSVDLAFIDGDHRIRGCIKDWEEVDPLLAPGGIVILHDTDPGTSGWLGPRFLMEEITRQHGASYRILDLPTPDSLGVAVIQKCSQQVIDWHPPLRTLIYEKLFHWLRVK